MNKNSIRRLFLALPALCLTAVLAAQTVKTVSVSNEASYTDHISLAEDSRDMDVMVKFIFDEEKNVLTVSVLSYRSLFVFREAARYPMVVKCHRLMPDRLPYLAEADPGSRFKLSGPLRRSLPTPHKDYVFRRWIEYEGLQPVPTDYKMVNDYIEQSFDIVQKRNFVSVTLRDLYLLERTGNKASAYELLLGRDLNTRYQIEIKRNPCFGMDEEIGTARNILGELLSAYTAFRKNYGSGEVPSEEALKLFEQTRSLLLTQFPARKNLSECGELRQLTEQYNHYVDSIGTMTCKVRPLETGPGSDGGRELDTKFIYSQARQIDKAVARWLVSKDPFERRDLVVQCQAIVQDVSAMIARHKVATAEEQRAIRVYNQAERYFRKTCGQ